MIPQIGFSEMLLLGILALVVVGPKDLPLMMRKFGRFTGKLRMMAYEFRQSFDELGRQAELDELRKEVEALKKESGLDEMQKEFEQTDADIAKDAGEAVNKMKSDFENTKAEAEIAQTEKSKTEAIESEVSETEALKAKKILEDQSIQTDSKKIGDKASS